MASYSYYINGHSTKSKSDNWVDMTAPNINHVRAKLIKRFGADMKANRISSIGLAYNPPGKEGYMVGELYYNKRKRVFEYGDDHVAYGSVNPISGRLTYYD